MQAGTEEGRSHTNHLFGAVAGDMTECLIHAQDDIACIGHQDAILRFKGCGGNAQCFLGLLSLGDVYLGACHTQGIAFGIALGYRAAIQYPFPRSRFGRNAVFGLKKWGAPC